MRAASVALCLLLTACPSTPKPGVVRIAAASDLSVAFTSMKAPYEAQSGETVEFVFGSSGQLAKQIAEGAPFDLFAAANVDFTDAASKNGACDPSTRAVYALGHLVLYLPNQKASGLAELKDGRFVKVAIANPELAPYGKAAKDALTAANLWADLAPKLVYGQNVQQTFQLARSGNAEAALVSKTQAPDGLDFGAPPLQQALVVCGKEGRGAKFRAFVLGADGRKLLHNAGFGLP